MDVVRAIMLTFTLSLASSVQAMPVSPSEPLDSHASRCSAAPMTEHAVCKEIRVRPPEAVEPIQVPDNIVVTVRQACGAGYQRVVGRCVRNTAVRHYRRGIRRCAAGLCLV